MSRSLALTAVVGIGLSMVCLSIAGTLYPGGTWLDGLPWSPGTWKSDDAVVTRELAWQGGPLEVSSAAEVHFQRADEWRATVTGPEEAIGGLQLADGRLRIGGPGGGDSSSLDVQLAGPSIGKVTVAGSGEVSLEGIDQPSLEVAVVGSGSVTASGVVQNLAVQVVGSGDADLGGLSTRDLNASILGSGDATVAPSGKANVRIVGSGDLVLLTRPGSLSSRVSGSGEVRQANPAD